MSHLRQKLDADRRTLLDLSLRNTLLNFRVLKGKGLEIDDELPEEVFRLLVDQSKPMSFLPIKEEEESELGQVGDQEVLEAFGLVSFDQPDDEENGNGVAARHTDTKLQTSYSSKILQRRLLNSFYSARTSIEEHGVNTLLLALGMLHWTEAEHSDRERLAPLILIPVELSRSSVQSKFRIQHTGDDIGVNLSLQQKLRIDFRVELPELPDDEEIRLEDYFQAVEKAVQNQPGWHVGPKSIQLGFFSFAKFLMYEDLDVDHWPDHASPEDHDVLSRLLEVGFGEPRTDLPAEEDLDAHIDFDKTHNIWDADSSQTLAILNVLDGRNLVIQGPPGTGKSQTITNLTETALDRNIETGILLRDRALAASVASHFRVLIEQKLLSPLPME